MGVEVGLSMKLVEVMANFARTCVVGRVLRRWQVNYVPPIMRCNAQKGMVESRKVHYWTWWI